MECNPFIFRLIQTLVVQFEWYYQNSVTRDLHRSIRWRSDTYRYEVRYHRISGPSEQSPPIQWILTRGNVHYSLSPNTRSESITATRLQHRRSKVLSLSALGRLWLTVPVPTCRSKAGLTREPSIVTPSRNRLGRPLSIPGRVTRRATSDTVVGTLVVYYMWYTW